MSSSSAVEELPLFLLHAVLFPGMALSLRVFEPRYRQMLAYCQERDGAFGVLLIKEGPEVGGAAEPHRVGTRARITRVQPQSDGTLGVRVLGERRFRVLETTRWLPFPLGLVEYLEEPEGSSPPALLEQVNRLSQRCLQLLLAMNGEWVRHIGLPAEPSELAYAVASRLPIDLALRQELLEAADAGARLTRETALLELEQERLQQMVRERLWLQSASLN